MMAAEVYFIYSGGGPDVIPRNATHFSVHESVTVIPALLFQEHPNIIELICHDGVQRIKEFAFFKCPRLRRVIIRGVKIVWEQAFSGCQALTYVECPKLERIGQGAFQATSLESINLTSVKFVGSAAFNGGYGGFVALKDVEFSQNLESIGGGAFTNCFSLERITIPLKNGFLTHDNTFAGCRNLKRVDLVEGATLKDTMNALLLEEWRHEMNEEVDSINQILPNARAGTAWSIDNGGKAIVIRDWIARVLRKVIDYKAQHRRLVNEAASALHSVVPKDIVINTVLPFLELPPHRFEGENEQM